MENHNKIILMLCVLGVFKEFRPSEPYLSPFLNGPKNLTETQINNDIYPVGTYSYMSLLIVMFLLTDWLKYKPVILLQGLSGVTTWAILLWCQGIPLMQVAQVSYGLFSAADVAYFSYLYAKIDSKFYQKATAQTKSALLVAKAGSGLVAQILVMYHILGYEELNYLTLSALTMATIFACFLPRVEQSYYFNRPAKFEDDLPLNEPRLSANVEEDRSYSLSKIFMTWKIAMMRAHTLKWSIWSAFSLCGYLQVSYYIQLLWQAVINSSQTEQQLYHGFSNSFNSLSGAACTYAVGYLKLDWSRFGELSLALSALIQGGLILLASYGNTKLIIQYVIYAIFKILYQVSSTIVSSEIAKSLDTDSYGLVFGANQFFALVAQSILTLLVTQILKLDIRTQFFLYGAYFMVLGVGFAIAGIITVIRWKRILKL